MLVSTVLLWRIKYFAMFLLNLTLVESRIMIKSQNGYIWNIFLHYTYGDDFFIPLNRSNWMHDWMTKYSFNILSFVLDISECFFLFLCSEFAEQFEIQLTGATGGAVLGLHLVSQITIAKSDSPQGMVRFLNQSQILLPNPDVTTTVSLVLERTGRLVEAQVGLACQRPNIF